MKHIKFTYVDAVTGVSVWDAPALNGPVFPNIPGLDFSWARESQYPTNKPEFFGTCPDDTDTQVDGVLGVYSQADWETMRDDEMRARSKVPQTVTMRQARLALLQANLLHLVDAAIGSLDEPDRSAARIEWEYSQEVERDHSFLQTLAAELGLTEEQIGDLFMLAGTL